MDGRNEAGSNLGKKKIARRRTPWHVTLLVGALWFLLCGGPLPQVIAVSGAMAAFGILYLVWPMLGRRDGTGDGGADA